MSLGNRGGRPPTPTSLKLLQGTFRADRHTADDIKAPPMDLEPPRELTGVAKAKWMKLAVQLDALGVLKQTDRDALEAYCLLWTRWKKLEHDSKRDPTLIGDMVKVFVQVKSLMSELGLTPSGRVRVKASPPDTAPASKLAKYLGGKEA